MIIYSLPRRGLLSELEIAVFLVPDNNIATTERVEPKPVNIGVATMFCRYVYGSILITD